jgi:hypothetical protein
MLVNLMHRGNDVVHIALRSEQQILRQPDCFAADRFGVGQEHARILPCAAGVRAEIPLLKKRLAVERHDVTGRRRHALSLQRFEESGERCAEGVGVEAEDVQVLCVARGEGVATLRLDAGYLRQL